jgi:hypothetical protein
MVLMTHKKITIEAMAVENHSPAVVVVSTLNKLSMSFFLFY